MVAESSISNAGPTTESKQFADFVQVVAHDLHQSIVTAHVYSEILIKALGRGDLDRAMSSAATIDAAIQELDRMVRDFVDGLLTEGSEILLDREEVDLGEFVSSTIADLGSTEEIDWIELECDQEVIVAVDPRNADKFRDVLEHLKASAARAASA